MKCAHPGRSLLATTMATPPHPAPLEKLRTACLLMGFKLAQSPVSRYQGGGSSEGREPGDSSHRQALPCPELCFQLGSKVPFILMMLYTLLSHSWGKEQVWSPLYVVPPLSAKKIGSFRLGFSLVLPLLFPCIPGRLPSTMALNFCASCFHFPFSRLTGIYYDAQFMSPAGDGSHGPVHARKYSTN